MMNTEPDYVQRAIDLAWENVAQGGQPFGALVVREGRILAEAANEIHLTQDPTAHAELLAIRHACQQLGSPRLEGAVIYASGQPCPMCLSASYLCGASRIVFAGSDAEGAAFGLSTADLYQALQAPTDSQRVALEHHPCEAQIAALYKHWWNRCA